MSVHSRSESGLYCFVFLLLFHFFFSSVVLASTWEKEIVDSSGEVGLYSSIDTDGSNHVHIGYFDDSTASVVYATNASGSWAFEDVDTSQHIIKDISLAVDLADDVHISYHDDTDNCLKYATKDDSGSWVLETVDGGDDVNVGRYCSIAVDPSYNIHISYQDVWGHTLKYAAKISGAWEEPVTVPNSGYLDDDAYTSIAVESSGIPHISYYVESSETALKYATNASGQWQTETVESAHIVGKYSSIALDSTNNVHISYFDDTSDDLKYASKGASRGWTTETVESEGNVGMYTSIGIDSRDKVHISYRDFGTANLALKYATNDTESGGWEIETVDSTNNVGIYSSLAVDKTSKVHISYYDGTNFNLMYAERTGTDGNGDDNGDESDSDVYFNCFISATGCAFGVGP
jgi:hypothetical protein